MTQKIEIFNFLYIFQNDCSLSHTAQGPRAYDFTPQERLLNDTNAKIWAF